MKGIENTSTINFGDLIGNNRKYIVPRFQRDYSWEEQQWDDLWQDIISMMNEKGDHYMGYLVLQSSDSRNNEFRIIDGQQHFTTITLLILALIKAIKKKAEAGINAENNKSRYETLMQTYIGRMDPVSLEYDNILVLNKNDDPYYRDYIVKLGELRSRNLLVSQKLLKNCFEWYEVRVNGLKYTDQEYADFIVKLVSNLFFTVITVNDEMNAFRVFETLNARGVQLSSADLLKNYLFSLVDDDHSPKRLNDLEAKWNELSSNVKTEKLPDFIRYYWNIRNKSIRSTDLFKAIRKKITNATEVFELVNQMLSYSDVYMALKDPNDEMWQNHVEISRNIELLKLFGLKQPYSVLMVAYKKLPLDAFEKLLSAIVITCFRYNVICSKNPNDIEKVFNDIALSIYEGQFKGISQLQKIYITDSEFQNSFAIKSFVLTSRNTKVIRYILGMIEQNVEGGLNVDIHDDANSIEHILPQNPGEEWNIDQYKADQYVNRVGNMCLLDQKVNRQIGNLTYSEKKEKYRLSEFATTRKIPEHYNDWNENTILSRQKQMAKRAVNIWRLQF
ncbi:MAG: DUF262 domain-containing HNH endonuclease family protein [Prevotella sp.]|jgi:uncharacterized protein with ParB-like and HNH nuclease domain|nr:DUF262 domain-containing HNH endonuclease family protein [Prevotella sp.]